MSWFKNNTTTSVSMFGSSTVRINGKTYKGNNITVKNDVVYIDGKKVDDKNNTSKTITIEVVGDVKEIKTGSGDVNVHGNSGPVKTGSGDVDIHGEVSGSVTTMSGDVEITGDVNDNVTTMSGDIRCKSISGDASSISGDVK